MKARLAIIIGSTREGRFAPTVARWFVSQVRSSADFSSDVIDLARIDLPNVLRKGGNDTTSVDAYLERLDEADAFVIITPEYNHGYPASLKQAIDLAWTQWQAKPIAFVSYGGIAGGLRAVEQLRQVFAELHAVTVRDSLSFHRPWAVFDQDGQPRDAARYEDTTCTMLTLLSWWAGALRVAREAQEYPGVAHA